MQKKLNLKIKYREGFRPFAPSVLAEDTDEEKALICSKDVDGRVTERYLQFTETMPIGEKIPDRLHQLPGPLMLPDKVCQQIL